jgi:hypothetical protein
MTLTKSPLEKRRRLRINIADTYLRWLLRIEQDVPEPESITVTGIPSVSVGRITVDFDHPGDPPPPLDQVDDWVLTTVLNALRPSLNRVAEEKAKIRLVRSDLNNDNIRLRFVNDHYFPAEAAILTEHFEGHGG